MPLRLLKLALKARESPEVSIVLRVVTAIVGLFVLVPVLRVALDPTGRAWSDWVGVAVFAIVGGYLLHAALRGRWT